MRAIEIVGVFVPILAVAIGAGLFQRAYRGWGLALMGLGLAIAVGLLVSGRARPLLGLIGFAGLIGGPIVDEQGKRALGLAGIAVGLFALVIAVFYT
jgi:hypothetical protein